MIYWRVNNKKLHSFEDCTNIHFVIATNLNINWMYSIIQRRGGICYWRNSFAASHWPNVVDGVQRDMWLQSQKLHQNPIRVAQVAWNQFSKVILILPDSPSSAIYFITNTRNLLFYFYLEILLLYKWIHMIQICSFPRSESKNVNSGLP